MMVHLYKGILCSRKRELLPVASAWMELENTMLSEIRVVEREIPYDLTNMRNLMNKVN